jgi:hypothetical protein
VPDGRPVHNPTRLRHVQPTRSVRARAHPGRAYGRLRQRRLLRPDIEAIGFTTFPAGLDWRADTITHAFPDIPPPGPQRSRWADPHWRRPILGGLIIEFEPAA